MFSGFYEPLGFEKLALAPLHPFYIEMCVACWPDHWPVSMQRTQNTAGGAMGARREVFALFSHGIFAYFLPNHVPDSSLACFAEIHRRKMVVTWREHEHEEEDMVALHDPGMVTALRNCGLLKFFPHL